MIEAAAAGAAVIVRSFKNVFSDFLLLLLLARRHRTTGDYDVEMNESEFVEAHIPIATIGRTCSTTPSITKSPSSAML